MLWKAAVMCVWCTSGVPQKHLPCFLSLLLWEMDTIRKMRHVLGTAMFPLLSVSMWMLFTALGSHQPELSHQGLQEPSWDKCHREEVALCPGRGIHTFLCEWNGQCKRRDVPSCSHLVLSLLFVSLSRMGCAGTPVPCSAIPEGLGVTQGRYNSWFYSFLIFSHREAPPFRRRGSTGVYLYKVLYAPFLYKIPSLQSLVCIHGGFWDLRERSEDLAKSFFRLKAWDIFSVGVIGLVWDRITGKSFLEELKTWAQLTLLSSYGINNKTANGSWN